MEDVMTCTHHRLTRECFTCNPPDRDELMAAIKEAQAIEDRCRLEATAPAPLDILCSNGAMANTGEVGLFRRLSPEQQAKALDCGAPEWDGRYLDADERELAAERAAHGVLTIADGWEQFQRLATISPEDADAIDRALGVSDVPQARYLTCGCRPTDLWVLSDTGEEVCLCDERHPWPGHMERTIGSAPARAILQRQLAVVTTPFPQTEAFEELVRGLGDGSIWARDALMRAYEAGKAERKG